MTVDAAHFDRLYAADPDPWKFATSDYERDKYAATVAALPAARYDAAFEIGCSIGVLTRQLATRCGTVLGVDIAQAALDQAAIRCADQPGVRFARMAVPDAWPPGTFDLILWSEVLYYIPDRRAAATRTRDSLRPGGAVVLVNWHGPTDGFCTGDAAAEQFIADTALRPVHQARAERYRLDVLAA